MLENGKISVRQFSILVILFTIGTSVLIAPSGLTKVAKQDAWLAAIVGVLIGLLYALFFFTLSRRFPDKTLTEMSEIILGKWLGKMVALLYVFFFFHLSAILLRELGDFITTQVMPETPIYAIHVLFLSIVIMAVRYGIEVFTRAAEIFFPWVLFLFIFLVLLLTPEIEFNKLQPVYETGIKTIFGASILLQVTPFSQYVILLMILPYVNEQKGLRMSFLKGAFFGGTIIILVTALAIAVLGPDFTIRNIYPSFTLAKKIDIGNFLQRMEAIMAGIWFLTIFFKLTICFYATTLGLAQTLKVKSYRFLTLPLGMLTIVLSIVVSPNIVNFKKYVAEVGILWGFTFGLVLPMLLFLVAVIRGKIKKKNVGMENGSSSADNS